MKIFLNLFAILLGLLNLGAFIFWLSLVRVEVASGEQRQYLYTSVAFDLTLLQIMLAVVAGGLVLFAIYGYQALKEMAVSAARLEIEKSLKPRP